MSELISQPTASVETPQRIHSGKILAAALLTVLVPGAGHLISARRRRGILLIVFFAVLFALYWPLRLPQYQLATLLLILYGLVLCTIAAFDVVYAKRPGWMRPSRRWIPLVLLLAALALWIHSNLWLRVAGFGLFAVPSRSMEKTIVEGDRLIVDLRYYQSREPAPGDIIIFRKNGLFIAKRVIAVGGNTIEGRDGEVLINGQKLIEPYVLREGNASVELDNFGPVAVPTGKLFVMGDNRNISLDSRMGDYGPIERKDVSGRPLYVLRTRDGELGPDLR
ncbi:MAG TPA: signal peptidase I [Candidatus Angelobacter sp.]